VRTGECACESVIHTHTRARARVGAMVIPSFSENQRRALIASHTLSLTRMMMMFHRESRIGEE
jgi:hypothetical protein